MGRHRPSAALLLLAAALAAATAAAAAGDGPAGGAAAAAGRWLGDQLPDPSWAGDVAAPQVPENLKHAPDHGARRSPAAGDGAPDRRAAVRAALEHAVAALTRARERASSGAAGAGAALGAGAAGAAGAAERLEAAKARLKEWGHALAAALERPHPHGGHTGAPHTTDERSKHSAATAAAGGPPSPGAPPTTDAGAAAAALDSAHHQAGLAALQFATVHVSGALPQDDAHARVMAAMDQLAAALVDAMNKGLPAAAAPPSAVEQAAPPAAVPAAPPTASEQQVRRALGSEGPGALRRVSPAGPGRAEPDQHAGRARGHAQGMAGRLRTCARRTGATRFAPRHKQRLPPCPFLSIRRSRPASPQSSGASKAPRPLQHPRGPPALGRPPRGPPRPSPSPPGG